MSWILNKPRYFVGIDPGRHTGLAVWDRVDKRFTTLREYTFWEAVEFLQQAPKGETAVIIEDPNQNLPLFAKGFLNAEKAKLKAAQDVGRNKEQAFLLIELCNRHNIPCRAIRPVNRKLNAKTFKAVTGVVSRTNQHVRDAGMLCFNTQR